MSSINEGSYCRCKAKKEKRLMLDVYGYHLTILCGQDGYMTMHDGLVHKLKDCCHANGVYTQLEPFYFTFIMIKIIRGLICCLLTRQGFSSRVSMTHCIRSTTKYIQAKKVLLLQMIMAIRVEDEATLRYWMTAISFNI